MTDPNQTDPEGSDPHQPGSPRSGDQGPPRARRRRNAPIVVAAIAMLSIMLALVSYSPTLYRMFCAATGYGGAVQRSTAKKIDAPGGERTITVRFDANVAPGLDWDFKPEQRSVVTRIGKPTKAYYTAHNNSDHTIVARATYNVTPYYAAAFFFKIQCFCFTEEKLAPGETARMPLIFYVDEQMDKDESAKGTKELTLSYTFFASHDQSDEAVAAARGLKVGSKAEDDELAASGSADFTNETKRTGSGSPVVR